METVPPFCQQQASVFSNMASEDFLSTEEELAGSPILYCFKSSSSPSENNKSMLKRKRDEENIFEQEDEDFCTNEDLCEQDTKRRRLSSLSSSTAPSSDLDISLSQEGPESAPCTTSTIPPSTTTPSTATIAPSPQLLRPTSQEAASSSQQLEQENEPEGFQDEIYQDTLEDLMSRSAQYEQGKKAFISRGLGQIYAATPQVQKWGVIVFEWLYDVLLEVRAKSHLITLYSAATYFLRVLCLLLSNLPEKKSLQKIATACLIIALKREAREEDIPSIDKFVELTNNTYSRKEIIECEGEILNILEWDLEAISPAHFLEFFLEKSLTKEEEQAMTPEARANFADAVERLVFLALLAPRRVVTEKYSDSMIAAAAVNAARSLAGLEDWTPALEAVSSFSSKQLAECSNELRRLHSQDQQQQQ